MIDDRPLHLTALDCPEGCIPALDDPGLLQTNTTEDWLADDPVVFNVAAAQAALGLGQIVEKSGVTLRASSGGFIAIDAEDTERAAHQAFWFAWSQFYPETDLWTR
jgi:hypothetical protein